MPDILDDGMGMELPFAGDDGLDAIRTLLRSKIAEGQQYAQSAVGEYKNEIRAILDKCRNCIGDCHDCIRGRIHLLLESANTVLVQNREKARQHLWDVINTAAGYAFPVAVDLGLIQTETPDEPLTPDQLEQRLDTPTMPQAMEAAAALGQNWRGEAVVSAASSIACPPGYTPTGYYQNGYPVCVDGKGGQCYANVANNRWECSKNDGGYTIPFTPGGATVGIGDTVPIDICDFNPNAPGCNPRGNETITVGGGGETITPGGDAGGDFDTPDDKCKSALCGAGETCEKPLHVKICTDDETIGADCLRSVQFFTLADFLPATVSKEMKLLGNEAIVDKSCGKSEVIPGHGTTGGETIGSGPGSDAGGDFGTGADSGGDFGDVTTTGGGDAGGDFFQRSAQSSSFSQAVGSNAFSVTQLFMNGCLITDHSDSLAKINNVDSTATNLVWDMFKQLANKTSYSAVKASKKSVVVGYFYTLAITVGAIVLMLPLVVIMQIVSLIQTFLGFPCGGNPYAISFISTYRGMANLFGGWFGFVSPQTLNYIDRNFNLACQTVIPSTAELSVARLKGWITDDQWRYGAKQNGLCLDYAEPVYQAQTEYIPGPADLVLFMKRDVFDENVVTDTRLAADFDKKFNGKAKVWAKQQGMTEEQFKYYYYAHWQMPSLGQAFEMYGRFRPDANVTTPDGDPLIFQYDDLTELMKINDVAPAYVDYLAALSSPPLGRIDIRRAYAVRALNDDDLFGKFKDLLYADDNAKILKEYTIRVEGPNRAKLDGQLSANAVDSLYIAGNIGDDEYKTLMKSSGVLESTIETRKKSADARVKAKFTQERRGILQRAYLTGRLSDQEYKDKLTFLGLNDAQQANIFKRDSERKKYSNKQIALSKACLLVRQGLITGDEYVRRAVNLGYTHDDALIQLNSCEITIAERINAKAQADARRQIADNEKQAKLAEREQDQRRKLARERWPFGRMKKPLATSPDQNPPEPFFDVHPPQPPMPPLDE